MAWVEDDQLKQVMFPKEGLKAVDLQLAGSLRVLTLYFQASSSANWRLKRCVLLDVVKVEHGPLRS